MVSTTNLQQIWQQIFVKECRRQWKREREKFLL